MSRPFLQGGVKTVAFSLSEVGSHWRVWSEEWQNLSSIFFFFFFFKDWLIDWLIAMLGLRFSARAFSSCGKRGPLFSAVRGPLTIMASLVAEHRLQTCRLSSCGSRAQLLCGMWDLPRPGLERVSRALAGRFSTTAPAGKPWVPFLNEYWLRTEWREAWSGAGDQVGS